MYHLVTEPYSQLFWKRDKSLSSNYKRRLYYLLGMAGGISQLPPTSLTATFQPASIFLAWVAPSGAVTYNIYRSTTSGGETLLTGGVSGTTYTDSAITGGTTYYYTVTAVNSSGQESAFSNEASSNDLPSLAAWCDVSSPGSLSGDGAVALASASSQYLSVASNSTLQTGNVDWFMGVWFNVNSAATFGQIVAKYQGATSGEYYIDVSNGVPEIHLFNAAGASKVAAWGSTLSASTNYFAFFWYCPASKVVGVSISAGVPVTTDTTGFTPNVGTDKFAIGADLSSGGTNPADFFDGKIGPVVFGKPSSTLGNGGGGTLAATINAALYASGSGLDPRDLTPAQKSAWGVVSAWAFGSTTNLVTDYVGTNTLTNNNAATYAAGPVTTKNLQNNDAVSQINDLSGLGHHLLQATASARPLYIVNGAPNGKLPCVRFTAANHTYMKATFTLNNPFTLAFAGSRRTIGTGASLFAGSVSTRGTVFDNSLTGNWSQENPTTKLDSGIAYDTSPHLFSAVFNSPNSFLVVDATQGAIGATGTSNAAGVTVGAAGTPGAYSDFDLYEGVACGTNLSFAQCVQLDGYIKPKWGTT